MRRIQHVAVLGAGVMGAGIACHLANAGFQVLLLDIVTPGLAEDKQSNPDARNQLVNRALAQSIKSKPAPLYQKEYANRIQTGNLTDDLHRVKDCDWIVEVVVERLDIKQQLFAQVEEHRRPGTLVTSNTSGIPIHLMTEGRSEDFKRHFCGTHFFNPPRYLRLLEIIPTPDTAPEVTQFFLDFGANYLGKKTVLAKDTPAFIANRIGVYAMARIYQLTEELGLPIDVVDKLTGPALGRPKTGTFRLGDLVGHDTAAHVIEGIRQNCPTDEQAATFQIPAYLKFLLDNKFLGNKTGQGFYKKVDEKDEKGRSVYHILNLKTLAYQLPEKVTFPSLEAGKQIDDLGRRVNMFFEHSDDGAKLIQKSLLGLFAYASNRIPEIADEPYRIDDALKAGFAWEAGPFELWDMIGLETGIKRAEAAGETIPAWVQDMVQKGHSTFYTIQNGRRYSYQPSSGTYIEIPGQSSTIQLDYLRHQAPVYQNDEVVLHDIGEGVLCLEFRSKMNAIGEGILRGLQESIQIAEEGEWKGLVIGNHAQNFTVGANLMMIAMMAYQQEWDELNMAINLFQQTTMRCRYSNIPVVAATQGYVFGGGCEAIMHCDGVVAAAESYIGLVEVGVGLIPGGGGTKEFAVRISDSFREGDVQVNTLIDHFKTIATAAVSTSAYEAYGLGYLQPEKDQVVLNLEQHIFEARARVLALAEHYVQPIQRDDVTVLGRGGLAALYAAANELKLGKWASEHDIKIARKVAWVLCGGDLTGSQNVSEQYLLDVEREAFMSLCGEQKTLERVQHMLQTGKPLRN
ncbi:MAG: enoyl-CoA hydratase/isomerase family protein [Saprospiraceae bacterium]|nr:enoyl-CoA hydratase/isomerase family protein [Saprospiraceae bacterium]